MQIILYRIWLLKSFQCCDNKQTFKRQKAHIASTVRFIWDVSSIIFPRPAICESIIQRDLAVSWQVSILYLLARQIQTSAAHTAATNQTFPTVPTSHNPTIKLEKGSKTFLKYNLLLFTLPSICGCYFSLVSLRSLCIKLSGTHKEFKFVDARWWGQNF